MNKSQFVLKTLTGLQETIMKVNKNLHKICLNMIQVLWFSGTNGDPVIKDMAEIWTTFEGGEEGGGGKETLEEGRGRRRKRITIIKEIKKSDTFFIFTNIDDITGKTNIFIWLLIKLLYLLCFSLWSDINIRTPETKRTETQDKHLW